MKIRISSPAAQTAFTEANGVGEAVDDLGGVGSAKAGRLSRPRLPHLKGSVEAGATIPIG